MSKNNERRGPMGGGPMGLGASAEKAKDLKGTLAKLMDYMKPYRLLIVIVLFFAIGSAAFSIVGPKILSRATNAIFDGIVSKINGDGGGIDFIYIRNVLFMLLVLYIISLLLSVIQGFIMTGIAQKVSFNMRKDISEKINRVPLKYFDTRTHGEILSRVTNDVDTISQTLNQSLSQILTSVTTLVGVLIMMFSINWIMALVAVTIIPVSGILIRAVVKRSQKYFKTQQEYLGYINGQVEEVYSGNIIVSVFNAQEKENIAFQKYNTVLYESAWKSQFLSGMMMPIMNFIGNIGYVLISILGGFFAIRGAIEVGDILAFTQYVRSFTQPIAQVAQIANVLQSTAAAAERVFEFLAEDEEVMETDSPVENDNIVGEVKFKDVHFGYNDEKIIINDFSTIIKPGQSVAIVGPTGAGKTTIVKLLMRFYELNSGSIEIDNNDIRDFRRKDLREIFGMVLQDTWLFNGTIMENLRYGNEERSDEEVLQAAKAAHVDSFIKTLPNGYNMELNEEASNISQGQKQLITIARAILSDPKILILDEATSSVDTRTEVLIQKAMDNLMKNRTSFIIAHRLSTIREADIILVMKDGDIIEQGNHNELLEKKGFYANLYNSQFEDATGEIS